MCGKRAAPVSTGAASRQFQVSLSRRWAAAQGLDVFEKKSAGKVNYMLAVTEQLPLFESYDYQPVQSVQPCATDALGPVLGLALIVIAWLPVVWLIWTLS